MTPNQLSQRLAQRAIEVVSYLYPHAKRSGQDYVIGGTDGDAGDSMKIQLAGQYAGHWKDWATDEHGDLLDLWCVARGIDLTAAMQEVASYLGIIADGQQSRPRKSYRTPDVPREAKRINSDGPVMAYLKSRGLTEVTIAAFKIAEQPGAVKFPDLPNNPGTIVFPYLRDGKRINFKYLALERPNGKKKTLQESNTEPCLFGWQAISDRARTVVICEGELEAPTWFQMGWPALSVPMGGGTGHKQDWIEADFDRLERFDTIYVAMDMDEPGQAAAQDIIRRLGADRCRLVSLPYKDANEALMAGATHADFDLWLKRAKTQDPDELKSADHFTDAVLAEFYPSPDTPRAVLTPWRKADDRLQFRSAEVTIWTGYSGHGKSAVLNHVAAASMTQGDRWCIASMEMPAARNLSRMVRQLTGQVRPSQVYTTQSMAWLGERLWMFDLVGTAQTDRLLEVFSYAARRYEIRHFIVDSLSKCGLAEDDYSGQKAIVERLSNFAHAHQAHVHLVCHARKGSDELSPPGKMEVKGTGALTDMADNVVTVWRNKLKEAEVDALDGQTIPTHLRTAPDVQLMVSKQRYTGWEGCLNLWFDTNSLQYMEAAGDLPRIYFPN